MVGDYDQFKGTKGLRLMNVVTESNDFKISSYINSNLSEDKGAYVQPRIEISPLEFKYLRVGKESTADREIIYNIKACFKNGLDQKSLQGVAFNVHGFRQSSTDPVKTLSLTADNSSCINWDESLTFKYYECHRHLTGFIEIENQDLAVQQKLEVALNPWEPTGSFARNLLKKEDHDNLITDCKKENILPSMMSLKTMTYSTFSYNYEIDPLLNLTFKKKLRFKLDAVVNIASDMNKGRTDNAQKLRPGVYLLKLALIKNRDYYNEKTYVSSVEKLVATIDGDIRTDVEFKTADLKAIKGRNTLLLELDPVREDKVTVDKDGNVSVKEKVNSLDEVIDYNTGLYNRTFNAAMSLNADADYEELTPLDPKDINQYLTNANLPAINGARSSMVREYIKYGAKLAADNFEAQKVQADMDLFAKNNSLKKISIQGMNGAEDLHAALAEAPTRMNDAHIKEELGSFATTGKMSLKLSRGFCSFWFKNFIAKDLEKLFGYHSYVECDLHANRPEQLFTIEKRLFVKDFESYGLIKGYNSNLSVSNNITLSKSQSQSTSFSKSLNINVDFSFLNSLLSKVARLFSVGISGSYSISQSDSRAEANSNSVSVGTGVSLLLQQNIYQLKLKRYQECSTVKINPTQFLKKGLFASALKSRLKEEEKAEIASRGLMICTGTDNTTPLVHNENYYLLTQDLGGTQIQDSGD
ncbi:MAG: hypothetical protein ACXVCD_19425, partial [Pseudobdellovibrionaceae bacterium]